MSQGVLAADSAAAAVRERIRVPLLARLIDESAAAGRRVWLDLGQIQARLLAKLQRARGRLIVADLAGECAAGREEWYLPDAALDGAPGTEKVDCLLCWDLLNYLQPAEMGRLAARIVESAAPGCVIHALIHYSGREMPARPQRFRMIETVELEVEPTNDDDNIASPRFSPKALEKAMPGLAVDRTMLLNNGMQEFLFVVRPEPTD